MSTSDLVDAIHSHAVAARFAEADPATADPEAMRALATCRAIGARMAAVSGGLVGRLADAGVEATDLRGDRPRQLHAARIRVSGPDDAHTARAVLADDGWGPHHDLSPGAERSRRHNTAELHLLRRDDVTSTLTIEYGEPLPADRWRRLLRPGTADWLSIDLPASLWWAYRMVRPVRLAASRIGLPTTATPEPFLSTPVELIGPLLELAGADEEDVVADLGCGDGRLVVAAAERLGCRAVGVERDPARAALARQRAATSPAADRIEIRTGDAATADLAGVTVVLMFLPIALVGRLLPDLLTRLGTGARVLAHEQSRLPPGITPPPAVTAPVIASESLTVAHVWTAP